MHLALLSAILFASTNIDDFLLLLTFFAVERFSTRNVIIGQYLGLGALVIASWVFSLVSLVAPEAYIGLLGLFPILIGVMRLFRPAPPGAELGMPPAVPATGQIAAVVSVTIANGSDNLAAYTSAFATLNSAELGVLMLIFVAMTALWVFAAKWIGTLGSTVGPVRQVGRALVPFALILIGLMALYRTGAFSLLFGAG